MMLRRPLSAGATPILLSVVPSFEYTHASVPGVSEMLSPAITGVELHPVTDFDLVKPMWLLTKPRPHLSVSVARYPLG
jgi:hypothetical protein